MANPPLVELPESACANGVIMTMTNAVGSNASPFTYEEQTFKWPGQIWSIDFTLPDLVSQRTASEWVAFGLKLEGSWGRFLMGDPARKQPMGVATGTPLVMGAGQEGGTLLVDGFTPDTPNILMKGDYIQLGSGLSARLHCMVEDANSDAMGRAVLQFQPEMRYSPADNLPVIVRNAKGVFKMQSNSFSWRVRPRKIYNMNFKAVEVVNA